MAQLLLPALIAFILVFGANQVRAEDEVIHACVKSAGSVRPVRGAEHCKNTAPTAKLKRLRQEFVVWATSDHHVEAGGHDRLAEAIRQSEGEDGFDWDIMLAAGDLATSQPPPTDADGEEILRQFGAMRRHTMAQVYPLCGNHDGHYTDLPSWCEKWIDPTNAPRLYPVRGSMERYKFRVGNVLFLVLSDRNDAPQPVGRGDSAGAYSGGMPPGAVTRETFDWWKDQVLRHQGLNIFTVSHQGLRDTTLATGWNEGTPRYHGGPRDGSSWIYWVIESEGPFAATPDAQAFEVFLADFYAAHGRPAIDAWVHGHTHPKGPDDVWGGKTITETRWGVSFLNVAAIHGGRRFSMSRVLTFRPGQDWFDAQVYLHSDFNAPIGWYEPQARVLTLRHKFHYKRSRAGLPGGAGIHRWPGASRR